MNIASFNVNKFCGPYSNRGMYYNPKNIDFKTPIKEMITNLLKTKEDIVFLQEFIDNKYVNVKTLFPEDKYRIHIKEFNPNLHSSVVAITLKETSWQMENITNNPFPNKIIKMCLSDKKLNIVCFHNTDNNIKKCIEAYFNNQDEDIDVDIILGDFNNTGWINKLNNQSGTDFRDLVTNDMITYKPGQTAIDRIFVRKGKYDNVIIFNGVHETCLSDHNLLCFSLNI